MITKECMGCQSSGERLVIFFLKNVNCTMREQKVMEITLDETRLRMVKDIKTLIKKFLGISNKQNRDVNSLYI